MGMNGETAAVAGRRHRRRPVMAEINVTPMVDVMLVLLIIFMVSAPLLTVGVPLELPQTQAKSLDQDKEPLTVSVKANGQIYLQNTEIAAEELVAKLKVITEARRGADAPCGVIHSSAEGVFPRSLFPKKYDCDSCSINSILQSVAGWELLV